MKKTLIWNLGRAFSRTVTSSMFNLHVCGRDNIPRSGGALIVSNHQSYLDPVLLGVQLDRPMSYLAKSELFEVPGFEWLIRKLNAFPVRQGEGDVGAVRETIRRLQEGHLLNIFPEGTRTENGELSPIQPGVALIIRRAKVPVIPAVIEGSFAAWRKGKSFPRSHPIRVMFGRRLDVEDKKPAQIVQSIDRAFKEMLAELREKNQET